MNIGIALSGGGIRGAAHIGILRALEEKNIKPSMISGASSGSIVASLYAMGYTLDEIEKIFSKLSKNLIDFDLKGFVRFLTGMAFKKNIKIDGLIRGEIIERILRQLTLYRKFEKMSDIKMPLAISSVDINTSEIVMFTSERLYDNRIIYNSDAKIWEAVRASISFPLVFKPKFIGKRRLVDGGVRCNIPAKVLKKMGADKVIAVNLGYCGEHHKDIDNIFEIVSQTIDIMTYSIFECDNKDIDYILKPRIYDMKLLEVDRIDECIERGYHYTKSIIPELKYRLKI